MALTLTDVIPTGFDVYNKGLYLAVHDDKYYPRSGLARYWLDIYHHVTDIDGEEPTAIHVRKVWQVYVSPAEGGTWDERKDPINYYDEEEASTICVFNKKQCIRELIALTRHHELHHQPRIDTTADHSAIDVDLGHGWCKSHNPEPYC
mgnify:CR=1 FL=1